MRKIERIDNFLRKVSFYTLFSRQWKEAGFDARKVSSQAILRKREIRDFWKEHPYLSISQVLISLDIIEDVPGIWYFMEDDEILISQGFHPSEVYLWGTALDKNGKPLPSIIWRTIGELDTEHLEAIVNGGFVDGNPKYKKIMENLIEERNEAKEESLDEYDDNEDYDDEEAHRRDEWEAEHGYN